MKLCPKCNKTKPLSDFYKSKASKDGLQSKCKACDYTHIKIWHAKNREKTVKYVQAYAKNNPEKTKARNATNYAILMGRLTRNPCEICGDKRSDAHHSCYDMPLVVTWLCRRHHKQLHKEFDSVQI